MVSFIVCVCVCVRACVTPCPSLTFTFCEYFIRSPVRCSMLLDRRNSGPVSYASCIVT